MQYFVMSDIHGGYNAMRQALNDAGYDQKNSNHTIIICGDMFGRAMENQKDCFNIWKYLSSKMHVNKPICLRGNHETILIEAIKRHELTATDIYNGEHKTFASFLGQSSAAMAYDCYAQFEAAKVMYNCGFMEWLESLPWYFETENYVFTHGFLPFDDDSYFVTKDFDKVTDVQWHEASWTHTLNTIRNFKEEFPNGIGKTIVFGHWTTMDLIQAFNHQPSYYGDLFRNYDMKLIGLDATTVVTHKVLCIVIED